MTAPDDFRATVASRPRLPATDGVRPLARLVHLAVESDSLDRLLAAAATELGQPLAVAEAGGDALGHSPNDVHGRRAGAVAAAAARTGGSPPPGWRVIEIAPAGARPAVLAIAERDGGRAGSVSADVVAALVGDQLARAALRRAQAAGFAVRLAQDPALAGERARREAAAAGVALAPAYWPAVLECSGAVPRPRLAERVGREVAAGPPGALCATLDEHLVLLHPDGSGGPPPVAWFEQIVARVRSLAPASRAQVVAAAAAVEPGALSAEVAHLLRLCRVAASADNGPPVVLARRHALDRLLWDNVAPAAARGFVDERLGVLIAWDRAHRSDLVRVLEAALDFPRHEQAARVCFMHRNTFRHRLKHAIQLLADDLEDPDARLAVHVALKLHRALPPR